jgi:hypothetical protein
MRVFTFALLFLPAWAQPTVAPTGEPTGNPRGENTTGYNVRQSFELGYRWRAVDGSETGYRSMVNFGNGIRLLGTSLSVQSREGHGRFYDHIALNTQGLGNDPYQAANLRVEKNRLYRYDLLWRSNAYLNPGLRAPGGLHPLDTVRNLQDHDFTLFPQSAFTLFYGYSRNTQSGPGLSTANLFDASRGDIFPLFADIHRRQNEHRFGGEVAVLGFRLHLMRGWVGYEENPPQPLRGAGPGADPQDNSTLASFRRSESYTGGSPYWRAALFRESKYWAANARFTYVSGRRAFVTDELAAGTNRLGTPAQRQVQTFGDATRPVIAGNFTLSLFPASTMTLTNQTSLYHIRMQGNSWLSQVDNNAALQPVLSFEFLGIRHIANSTDAEVRLGRRFAVHAGYVFDHRRIRSVRGFETPSDPAPADLRLPVEQTNRLHAGVLGFRARPARVLSINLDAEVGRADNPFFPISERNYQALRGRVELKTRRFRAAGYARSYYNSNAASLANFASRSRQYGADLSWTPRSWFSLDMGYGKQHLDTLSALAYYTQVDFRGQLFTDQVSAYYSNIHAASLSGRFSIRERVDLSLGYSHVQDVGDPSVIRPRVVPLDRPDIGTFAAARVFPLRFNSPLAKVSVSITPRIRWNAGYQFYGYREDFATLQNYRAHTGYSSVSWSF